MDIRVNKTKKLIHIEAMRTLYFLELEDNLTDKEVQTIENSLVGNDDIKDVKERIELYIATGIIKIDSRDLVLSLMRLSVDLYNEKKKGER